MIRSLIEKKYFNLKLLYIIFTHFFVIKTLILSYDNNTVYSRLLSSSLTLGNSLFSGKVPLIEDLMGVYCNDYRKLLLGQGDCKFFFQMKYNYIENIK